MKCADSSFQVPKSLHASECSGTGCLSRARPWAALGALAVPMTSCMGDSWQESWGRIKGGRLRVLPVLPRAPHTHTPVLGSKCVIWHSVRPALAATALADYPAGLLWTMLNMMVACFTDLKRAQRMGSMTSGARITDNSVVSPHLKLETWVRMSTNEASGLTEIRHQTGINSIPLLSLRMRLGAFTFISVTKPLDYRGEVQH